MAKPLDNRHTAAEQDFVDARDFGQIVHVGDGRRLDAEQFHFLLDAPMRQRVADARQAVAINRRVVRVLAPVRAQQKTVAGLKCFATSPRLDTSINAFGAMPARLTTHARPMQRCGGVLVNRLGSGLEMHLRVHVRAAVRIKMQGGRVPAVALVQELRLRFDAAHAGPERKGQVYNAG